MLYYDISENTPQSKLPKIVIDYGLPFEGLERLTGADFVIIPESSNYEKVTALQIAGKSLMEIAKELQINLLDVVKILEDKPNTIQNWLEVGAILVQRKSGFDFVQSMGSRLNDAICRMVACSKHQYQRVILVTGIFGNQNGKLTINGNLTQWDYSAYLGAISSIKYKGCCVEFVANDALILEWIKLQETSLLQYKRNEAKFVIPFMYYPPDLPALDDPLQLMLPVEDARLCMIHIPGWGEKKINTLHNYVQEVLQLEPGIHPSLLQLLTYATSYEIANHLKGVGKGLIKNARDYVGLKENEHLGISNENFTVQKG